MFNKHEYTCPDVIYMRKRAKQNAFIQLGLMAAGFVGLGVVGWWTERQESKTAQKNSDTVNKYDLSDFAEQ